MSDAGRLILPFILTLLGSILGVSLYAYSAINLRGLFLVDGILIVIERGLFLGTLMGLGIFLTRLLVRRFDVIRPIPRFVLGAGIGALFVDLSVVLFQVLILKSPPTGWLIPLGATLIVLGFAISSLLSRPAWLVRTVISFVFIGTGLVLPWLLSLGTELDPVFHYDITWPLEQVLLVSGAVALCISFVSQLTDVPKAA